jgi:hypothetical protein
LQAGQVASYGRDELVDVAMVSPTDDKKTRHVGAKVGCYLQRTMELYVHFIHRAQCNCLEQSPLSWITPDTGHLATSHKRRLTTDRICDDLILEEVEYAFQGVEVERWADTNNQDTAKLERVPRLTERTFPTYLHFGCRVK